MRKLLSLFFILTVHHSSAQQWMEMMNDPTVNYYSVERKFMEWKDSVAQNDHQSLLYRLLHREKIEEQKEFKEEAQEHFYHWAASIKNEIDQQGNRLSPEVRWQELQAGPRPSRPS